MADTPIEAPAPLDEEAEARLLIGTVVGERYRLEDLLGVGGMGAVYRAQHVLMQKTLALKVLHRGMAQVDEVVARFEREAVAAGNIEHPNVARATDFGRLEDGSFFLVLEYVDGTSLRAVIESQGRMAPQRCIRIMRQIAGAVGAAHALGIVHRDLKPENVMLLERAEEPDFVKVLDFGIAKVNFGDASGQRALTRVGAVFGTPEYMSPEQALGEPVDARSDLYALGVILYEMLDGGTPFASEEPTRVLAAHITAPVPPLGTHVPAPLAAVVDRLLAKKPKDRVQSAKDLVLLLDEVAAALGPAPASIVVAPARQTAQSADQLAVASSSATVLARPRPAAGSPQLDKLANDALAFLRREVKLGGASVPVWTGFAGAGGAFFVLLVFVLVVARACSSSSPDKAVAIGFSALASPEASPAQPAPVRGDLAKEIQRIEDMPVYERKQKDWVSLGRGYAALGKCKDSAVAYRGALSMGRSPATDPEVLSDMLACGKDPDAYPLIVNQCEAVSRRGGMGAAGLDLLWDLWVALSQDPSKSSMAEQTFKKLVISSRRGTSGLRAAIEVNHATSCKAMATALAYAAKHADSRALDRLQQVEATRTGCGADKSEDCFECVRGGTELQEAITRARSHPAPTLASAYKE